MVWKLESNACDTKLLTVEAVYCFKYLSSQMAANTRCDRGVVHRMKGRSIERGER